LSKVDVIVLSNKNYMHQLNRNAFQAQLAQEVNTVRQAGYTGPIVVIGPRPTYYKFATTLLSMAPSVNRVNDFAASYLKQSPDELRHLDATLKAHYEAMGLYYYPLVETFCETTYCKLMAQNTLLVADTGHFTLAGSAYMGAGLADSLKQWVAKAYAN
jgi:lysophospholipase L1-like esterase